MLIKKDQGFSALAVILATLAIIAGGLIVWRVLEGNKQTDSRSANTDTPSQQQTEPEPQADPNEGYVVIREWGVRFKPVAGLEGVEYFKPNALTADNITFTTAALSERSEYCRASTGDILIGLLTRSTEQDPQHGTTAKIGDYYYLFRGPQAACSQDDASMQLESQTLIRLRQSLDTLEAAK